MSGFFIGLFGSSGSAINAFNGLWYIVGFFILLFFVMYLIGANVSFENIVFVILTFLLLSMSYGLFAMPTTYLVIGVVFIVLFLSTYTYYYFYKPD